MKILAIGNSFSQDATRYLHQIAKADGVDMTVLNLYIGGCPLSYHYSNTLSNERKYTLEVNGASSDVQVSIQDALLSGNWNAFDAITLQQVSSQSFDFSTFAPYIAPLSQFVRSWCPASKVMIHQTWAYKKDSPTLHHYGFSQPEDMFAAVQAAYGQAATAIQADGIIPSGTAFRQLMAQGIYDMHRDDIHASLGLGRYTLALTWYEALTGHSCIGNTFRDFDAPIPEKLVNIAQKAAHAAVTAK